MRPDGESEDPEPTASQPKGRVPDWQLPIGVDRALCEYLESPAIADDYDEYFATTNLLELDRQFLDRHFPRPGRLVDLGCGTGRLALHFARRGFVVVGVDLSEEMLRVTRQKAEREGLSCQWIHGNICNLSGLASGEFDYAISMFSTLGMIVGREERRRAFDEIHRVLRPGGLFGLHVHNRWFNLFDPQGRRWLLTDLGRQLVRSPSAGDKVQSRYRGIANLRMHLFSSGEIKRELGRAGFSIVELMPLSAHRAGALRASRWVAPFFANGWLIVARCCGS